MSFQDLGLAAELLKAVADQGYATPTPVQRQAVPVILEGRDVMAGAQTGTGKTAGFTLPLLQRLMGGAPADARTARALILTPTRELAAQVGESVRTYGKYLPLSSAIVFGGVGIQPQIQALARGVDVLVATPGRLLDHVGQKTVDLSHVEILVLDEADRMLDMGFIHDIRRILALLPAGRQNLLFSATFSDEIKQLADRLLRAPVLLEVARRNAPAEGVAQVVHHVAKEHKRALLAHLITTRDWRQVLVFTRTKHGANRLAQQLARDGISAAAIHGNKSQSQRTRALADFKQGRARVLVATDIAARGLDIDQLPHVVNFELPNVAEDYIHRIGRTGRAGASGEAASLVCAEERGLLTDIQRLIKRELPVVPVEGFVADAARPDAAEGERRRLAPARPARAPQAPRRDAGHRSPGNAGPRGNTRRDTGNAASRPARPSTGPRPSAGAHGNTRQRVREVPALFGGNPHKRRQDSD